MSDKPKAQTSLVLTSDDCEMDDDKGDKQKQLPCRVSADLHSIPKDSGGWNPQLTHLGIGLRKVSCFSKNSQVLVGEPVWEASPSLSYCLSVLSWMWKDASISTSKCKLRALQHEHHQEFARILA